MSGLVEMIRSFIPPLTAALHKGQCGRIGIIGGCKEYTGAPYFAAISALKVGADLSHVFCTQEAAPVIKSYSPEIIVHPILDSPNSVEEFCEWLHRLHVVVVGPGLGREPKLLSTVKSVMARVAEKKIPMIIDADGLFLVTQDPSVIENNTDVILTPNSAEFSRLYHKVLSTPAPESVTAENVVQLSKALGDISIIRKGAEDIITAREQILECSVEGSYRRCGGQGDLLCGAMGTFLHWAKWAHNDNRGNASFKSMGPLVSAAYAACHLTRSCNKAAFNEHGRSMTTSNMIDQIHHIFKQHYGG